MDNNSLQPTDLHERHLVHLRLISRMKLVIIATLVLACIFGLLAFKYLTRTPYLEAINNFDTEMVVQKTGAILVTESIVYDFGYNKKRGISRYIPLISEDNPRLNISVVAIEDEIGNPYQYESFIEDDIFVIKTGDPDKLISGIKTYRITYQVENAVIKYSKSSQIYWNVTGDQWSAAIKSATTRVFLPSQAKGGVTMNCFTGPRGSTEKSCSYERFDTEGATNILYSITKPLMIIEGFTIRLNFSL